MGRRHGAPHAEVCGAERVDESVATRDVSDGECGAGVPRAGWGARRLSPFAFRRQYLVRVSSEHQALTCPMDAPRSASAVRGMSRV